MPLTNSLGTFTVQLGVYRNLSRTLFGIVRMTTGKTVDRNLRNRAAKRRNVKARHGDAR